MTSCLMLLPQTISQLRLYLIFMSGGIATGLYEANKPEIQKATEADGVGTFA